MTSASPHAVALVASPGGHLAELVRLQDQLGLGDLRRVWVTYPSPQSHSLLAGEEVVYVDPIGVRDLRAVLRQFGTVRREFRQRRVDAAYSTGGSVAMLGLGVARSLGLPATYVESFARVDGPSLTGRALAAVPGTARFTQHERWANRRWRHRWTVLQGFALDDGTSHAPEERPLRVLVTLGTTKPYAFTAAVEAVARSLPPGAEVFWQLGVTPQPDGLPGEATDYLASEELQRRAEWADVVVAHSGMGSVLLALEAGRRPLLLPRRAAHDEHVDDHQRQIAETVAAAGLGTWAYPEDLTTDRLLAAAPSWLSVTQPT